VGTACELKPEGAPILERIELPVRTLRLDGETQSRTYLNPEVIEEYAELMLEGVEFPPVRACFDGASYWLTDGFHRVAATEHAQRTSILVEVFRGTLADARWDSYRANAVHGLRRMTEDLRLVVKRALRHDRAAPLSNRELARHLNVSEKTVRRVRGNLSAACAADQRVAVRNGREYKIHTANIGKRQNGRPARKIVREEVSATLDRRLAADLLTMEHEASADVRRILMIFRNWTHRAPPPSSVLQALESVVDELKANRIPLRSKVR